MKRVIITRPDLSGSALDELKDWLAITTPKDNAALEALLHAACDMCEGFTGQMPLESACTEVRGTTPGWQGLGIMPVNAVTLVEALATDGTTTPLAITDYALELEADGQARIGITRRPNGPRIKVHFTAGIAPDWASLPDALRHGILRLAAHLYRNRDSENSAAPPAAIAALWRPWRRIRLT